MNNLAYPSLRFLASGALFLLAGGVSHAALYTELFQNATTSNATLNSAGWFGYMGSAATDVSATVPGSGNRIGISNLAGNPADDTTEYLFAANSGGTQNQFWTAVDTTGVSIPDPTAINWRMGNASTLSGVRVLVEVGGSWFASAQSFTNTGTYTAAAFSTGVGSDIFQSLAYAPTAANWLDFTLNPGVAATLGGTPASDLPSLPLTGIGFLIDTGNAASTTIRLDGLQVVPEPSVAVLAGCGLLGLLRRRR